MLTLVTYLALEFFTLLTLKFLALDLTKLSLSYPRLLLILVYYVLVIF